MVASAGQWKYGQDRLKLQWAKQADGAKLLQKLASSKQLSAGVVCRAASSASDWDVLQEPPLDPVTGKLPLLCSAEMLHKDFWEGSKHGRAMLSQVIGFLIVLAFCCCLWCGLPGAPDCAVPCWIVIP